MQNEMKKWYCCTSPQGGRESLKYLRDASETTVNLLLSLPAKHPESHHLLYSEVYGIRVQQYGSFHTVSICVWHEAAYSETDGQSIFNFF